MTRRCWPFSGFGADENEPLMKTLNKLNSIMKGKTKLNIFCCGSMELLSQVFQIQLIEITIGS
jgi:hypothetical protein